MWHMETQTKFCWVYVMSEDTHTYDVLNDKAKRTHYLHSSRQPCSHHQCSPAAPPPATAARSSARACSRSICMPNSGKSPPNGLDTFTGRPPDTSCRGAGHTTPRMHSYRSQVIVGTWLRSLSPAKPQYDWYFMFANTPLNDIDSNKHAKNNVGATTLPEPANCGAL